MVTDKQMRKVTKLIFWGKDAIPAGSLGKGSYLFRNSSCRGKPSFGQKTASQYKIRRASTISFLRLPERNSPSKTSCTLQTLSANVRRSILLVPNLKFSLRNTILPRRSYEKLILAFMSLARVCVVERVLVLALHRASRPARARQGRGFCG